EIGLCIQAAQSIADLRPTQILCRRADVVTRYSAECGANVVSASVPPSLLKQQQATSAEHRLTLKINTEVLSPESELYIVANQINAMIYLVTPVAGGDPRYIMADEPGW